MRRISVAVPVPFLDALTYDVPDTLPMPAAGVRVLVPLGTRTLTGCALGPVPDAQDDAGIKPILDVLDEEPFLPGHVVELCRWVSEYYMAGVGEAIAAAMPPGAWIESERRFRLTDAGRAYLASRPDDPRIEVLRRFAATKGARAPRLTDAELRSALRTLERDGLVEPLQELRGRASAFRTRRVVSVTAHGLAVLGGEGSDLGPRQKAALEILSAAPSGISSSELRGRGIPAAIVARLVSRGVASLRQDREERDPFEGVGIPTTVPDGARHLTGEQQAAFDELRALAEAGEFKVALLHGVTGSGKTEIYLRIADLVLRTGRQVLLMVPEIALTPSVAALFRGAFGARVAIQHSGLSDGERHDQWQRIRRGEIDVVVGTRSAVFAPLPRTGLIIVDEEHDGSYKQEESPRYHGRDVAIVRGSRDGALVVLGSATPSLESYQNAAGGKYARLTLERRVLDRPLAAVSLVNMRDEYAEEGPDVVVSRALVSGIEERLARGEQVVVLLNRRGYATAVFCRQCGDTFECPNCSVSLTVHSARGGWRARCHYCNYSMMVPKTCRRCAAPYLEQAGFGTEKVEHQLRERFPEARIGRIDRDSVRRRGALTGLLTKFAEGELDVLVGTQMIAKGHDFPRVTLVGVISADVGLGLADFRAAERTFQLLTQVAGRAGRGERTGEAIVQTLYPEHYSIQLACRQDYPAFFEREIAYRRGMRYPPVMALVNTVVKGRTFDEAMDTARELTRRLEPATATGSFTILGPAPAPLGRLRGEHRVQFFLKGTRRAAMRDALRTVLAGMPEIRRRVTVDVDPFTVL